MLNIIVFMIDPNDPGEMVVFCIFIICTVWIWSSILESDICRSTIMAREHSEQLLQGEHVV